MKLITFLLLAFLNLTIYSQAKLEIILQNISEAPHIGVDVTIQHIKSKATLKEKTNSKGVAIFQIDDLGDYELNFSNSEVKRKLRVSKPGSHMRIRYKYDGGDDDWSKKYPPTAAQKKEWDQKFKNYPNTSTTSIYNKPIKYEERLVYFKLKLNNINKKPLTNELLWLIDRTYNKKIKGITDNKGEVHFLLPKGHTFDLNFKYHSNFGEIVTVLTTGTSSKQMEIMYLGTKEIEKRKKEEEIRIKKEEDRLARELEEFEERVRRSKKSREELKREELDRKTGGYGIKDNTIITDVFDRNKWKNKLIFCDLTGSMSPYASQLSQWYALNYITEKKLQFVFFNDGDNKPDNQKIIGETGGIYYSPSYGIDKLLDVMTAVSIAGSGGDCPENNMEALIKGEKQADPYSEIIMIADNNASVKDIELLENFNIPVHIILCGLRSSAHEDYLNIAYKTKGSIHTMEKDLYDLWKTAEGGTININGIDYTLMNGEFIRN